MPPQGTIRVSGNELVMSARAHFPESHIHEYLQLYRKYGWVLTVLADSLFELASVIRQLSWRSVMPNGQSAH